MKKYIYFVGGAVTFHVLQNELCLGTNAKQQEPSSFPEFLKGVTLSENKICTFLKISLF